MITIPYECEHCGKGYKREAAFLKHACKEIKRLAAAKTPIGQAAWCNYQTWMKMRNRPVANIESFMQSKSYTSCIKFAEAVVERHIPAPDIYIQLMVERDFPPTMWTLPEVHAIYLEHMDKAVPPLYQIDISVNTVYQLTDQYECTTSEIFNYLQPSELISLLIQRRFSPWFLLHSTKFTNFLSTAVNPQDYQELVGLIPSDYWSQQLKKDPILTKSIREIIAALEL